MTDVSVIGLGLMGSAIARTLIASGAEVTVWNRSPERAAAVDGAVAALSPAKAFGASPLTIVTVLDGAAAHDVIRAALADGVHGDRTILNLTTGAVADAVAVNRLVCDAGASYLDGAISGWPRQIGTTAARLFVAGPERVWSKHQKAILALSATSALVSERVDGATVLDHAVNGIFLSLVMNAFFEAAAYGEVHDVGVSVVADFATTMLQMLPGEIALAAQQYETGSFDTDQATIDVYEAGHAVLRDEVKRTGLAGEAHRAFLDLLRKAQARGLGDKAWAALLYELVASAGSRAPS